MAAEQKEKRVALMFCTKCGGSIPLTEAACPACGAERYRPRQLPHSSPPPAGLVSQVSNGAELVSARTRWLAVWIYVKLPGSGLLLILWILAAQTLNALEDRTILSAFAAPFLICVAAGLHMRRSWAWQSNWGALAIDWLAYPVVVAGTLGSSHIALKLAIGFFVWGALWVAPNGAYFLRRRVLFGKDSSAGLDDAAPALLRALRQLIWPSVADARQARTTASQGFYAAITLVTVGAVMTVVQSSGSPQQNPGAAGIATLAVMIVVAFGAYRVSRIAAIAGLTYFVAEQVLLCVGSPSVIASSVIPALILTMMFLNGVRGAIAYRRGEIAHTRSFQKYWVALSLVVISAFILRAGQLARMARLNALQETALVNRARDATVTVIATNSRGSLAEGTGVLVSKNGVFWTNREVLKGADSVKIASGDGSQRDAWVVLADDPTDDLMELITFVDADVPYLPIAKDPPRDGEKVIVAHGTAGANPKLGVARVSIKTGASVKGSVQVEGSSSVIANGALVLNGMGQVLGFLQGPIRAGTFDKSVAATLRRLADVPPKPQTVTLWSGQRKKPNPNDLTLEGMALWRVNQCGQASESFDQALRADPVLALAWWGKGLCALQTSGTANVKRRKANSDAEADLIKVIALSPEMAEAHLDLGLVYVDEDKRALAVKEYLVLTSLAPRFARQLGDRLAPTTENSLATDSGTSSR